MHPLRHRHTRRTKHGALLDAQILAEVYMELLGGKQTSLGLAPVEAASAGPALTQGADGAVAIGPRTVRPRLTPAERGGTRPSWRRSGPNAIWRDYLGEDGRA